MQSSSSIGGNKKVSLAAKKAQTPASKRHDVKIALVKDLGRKVRVRKQRHGQTTGWQVYLGQQKVVLAGQG
ncbi:unnamed protein product, partial [marine sediment metagenome]